MWVTLMVMAIMVSVEPVRIGFTVMMLSRPRPVLQLFAFLCGGFAMGLGVGLVVLFILQRRLITARNLHRPQGPDRDRLARNSDRCRAGDEYFGPPVPAPGLPALLTDQLASGDSVVCEQVEGVA